LRILYLADIRFPLERANGIQSMETCHALVTRGHDVTLVVRPDSHTPARDPFAFYGLPRIAELHIEVAPITGPAASRRVGYLTFTIGRALGRARQDVIFTRDLGLASLLLRLPAAVRAPVVYEAHGIAADGYVTITDGLAQELTRRFGERPRIAVVPDGARATDTADQKSGPPAFTIGYAGHLYPWKGVDLVIEAVAALQDTRGMIIGGHGEEPDLARVTAFAEQLHCSARVTFTGMIPPAEVAARLRDTDVLALPNPSSAISSEFTSPLKLFEYMASGRPIVASDLPSLREVLRDGENALLVEPGNPQALTAGIQRIKDDPALGRRLAAQALEDVREFTWARRAERLEAVFTEVLGVRGVRAE